ncbi:MAG: tyrosine-type recombinase/integrase [Lewinellaceae bacterium]|nr:tyrosine-type recombinase/integrase [Lewinellaceae bacterium]
MLNADELRLFLGAARSLRHRLVLELLFGLGLRASEVGRLRISDFNREQATVTIRTSKGGITRASAVSSAERYFLMAAACETPSTSTTARNAHNSSMFAGFPGISPGQAVQHSANAMAVALLRLALALYCYTALQ